MNVSGRFYIFDKVSTNTLEMPKIDEDFSILIVKPVKGRSFNTELN